VNVRDGEYFMLGDQLSLSTDSRNTDFGNISREEVIGRAEYALWPIRCFGSLTGQGVTAESTGQEGAE
jgi:signal peptidase I